MHIYAFGSLCRGEVDTDSDIDMLAITNSADPRFDPNVFSIYSYRRMQFLWEQGNPFAWHLSIEARIIYASDGIDYLAELGSPARYKTPKTDCLKFKQIYERSYESLGTDRCSHIFELSTIFLAVRNFATCFSLGITNTPIFSRHSAKMLDKNSLNISEASYLLLERSRILCTRASGAMIQYEELDTHLAEIGKISQWMTKLLQDVPCDA